MQTLKVFNLRKLWLSLLLLVGVAAIAVPELVETNGTIEISTVEQLKEFRDAVNNGNTYAGKTVKLTADLDLSGENNWTPIGNLVAYPSQSFNGTFDGDGHSISNVTSSDITTVENAVAGLFGSVVNGTIKNLTVKNVNITSSHFAAGIVAYTSNGPTIENCKVIGGTITSTPELKGSSYDNGDKAGGIMGYATAGSTINNCTVEDVTITAYRDMGGIVGFSAGTVTNNTVINVTVTQDLTNGYKNPDPTTFGDIIGRDGGATLSNNKVIKGEPVAKIGDEKYYSLADAVDAAQQMGGAVTVELIDDISGETVTIKEVANFKLTIDGKNKTVDATIVVDGLRGNGGSTTNGASVTLQNIAFVNNVAKDVINPTGYPHNLTIENCTYTGSTTSLKNWFVNVTDGPLYGATIKNVTVESSRLIQGDFSSEVVFESIVATNNVYVGFNIKTGDSGGHTGTVLIKDCQVTTAKYAFRDISDDYNGTITFEGNTFISTSTESDEGAIVNRGGLVGTGHINVVSGTYTGPIKVLNNKEGVLAISGGYFSEEFPQEYIAADLVALGKVCAPATDKEGFYTIGDPHYVAQIGEIGYVTLQSAVDAAYATTGNVTIELLDNITEYAIVKQMDGLNLTIDGKEKTMSGNIVVDGMGKHNGSETLTIQNVNFEGNSTNLCSETSSFVEVPSLKTSGAPYYRNGNNYAHNITIKDCSFTSTSSSLDVVAFKSNNGGGNCYNLVIKDVTATNLHSLAQLNSSVGATFDNCTATETGSFISVSQGSGNYIISNCSFESHPDKADGYAYREKSNSTVEATLSNNNFKAHDAIILGSAGTINVESGTYVGEVSKTAGTIAISGGQFSADLTDITYEPYIAEGKIGVKNNAVEGAPYSVEDGTYVAQVTIGESTHKYASLEAAISAAPDGATVTLLANSSGNGIKVPEGKYSTGLTVDFGGFTYTMDGEMVGSTGTQTQAFQLLKDNKITFKNGTIYSEKAKMLVQNYSDLTLQGMTLDGSALVGSSNVYTLSNNNGNVVIENSTITAKAGTGNFAFDVCRYASYPSVSVTVKGESVINGNIEVFASNNDPMDGFGLTLEAGTFNGNIVLDASAEAVLNATPEKAVIKKSNSLASVAAPQDYKWVDNGDGTSTLAPCVYVAQIGETKYESLTDAVNAATTGQTIELLADITTETGNKSLKEGVTLDGKGKTISGDIAIYISKNGGTVQNVNFKNIHNATKRRSAVFAEGLVGTATITDCTFDNCDWDAIQITPVAGANMVITNNTFSDDTEDGIQQQRYIHVQSAQNVDFSATITGNVLNGKTAQDPLGVYYPTDKTKVDLKNNYIENVDDICILITDDNGYAGELVFPAYTTAAKEETYTPEAYIQNDQYSAKFYMTFAEAATAAGNDKVVSLVTNVAGTYTMSEGQTLKVKKNGKTFSKPKGPDGFEVKDSSADGVTTYTLVEADLEYTAANGTVSYKAWSNTVISSDGTYKLLKDITASARIVPGTMATNVTLDLNGHTLTSTATDYAILLSRNGSASSPKSFELIDSSENGGGKLVANNLGTGNTNALVQVTGKYNDVTIGENVTIEGGCVAMLSENQNLIVNGTVNGGNDFAVASNGSTTKNTTITINEGAVLTSNVTAIYLPGNEGLSATINGGTITGGDAGVEVRAGNLVVNGGTITTTATDYSYTPNGSGTTTKGAAVAIAQHTTNLPINVTISGGSLEGASSLSIANPQENTEENVEVSVTDGTFTGEVKVTDDRVSKFLSGGYYSVNPEEEMIVDGKISIPATDKPGYWIIETGQYVAAIGDVKYASLEAAIEAATAGQTITLLADIDATAQVEVGKQVTLDLNGKTIEYKGTTTLTSGVLMVLRGGDLTITDSSEGAAGAIKSGTNAYAAIALTKAGETSTETAKLTVENGLLEGDYYGITGNGSRHGTEITINGGVIKGTHENDNLGIYHPQDGTLTINGGTISGYSSAVELRAGTLTVTGGTLSASCTEFTYNPNGSGTTTAGAVIAIAQHNTLKDINVNIAGATLNGAKTIAVTDAQKNNLQGISVSVADGLTENSYIPAAFKWVSDGTMSTLTPRDPIAKIDETVYYSLADAIADVPTDGTATTITMLADVTEDVVVKDGKNIVLDLGEKTLTGYIDQYDSELNVKNGNVAGTVYVNGGPASAEAGYNKFTLASDATITADYGIILYQAEGTTVGHGSTIDINGTVNGMVWVMGNIREGNSVINVNSGASIKGDVGVALNGVATLNVADNTTIEGAEVGIEVRAGNLNVEGGNIKSTATEYSVSSNGSGTTTTGAAIAVAQHTTGLPINANITGGTLSGMKTISVADPEGKDLEGVVVTVKDELTEGEVVIPDGYIWLSNNDGTSTLTKIEDGEYKLIDGIDYPFMNLKSDISVPEVTYQRSFSSTQNGKYQTWYVPMDYTITEEDAANFTFYKIHMIAGADAPGEADEDAIFLYITAMNVGETLKGNRPYVIKPGNEFTDYIFAAEDTKLYAPTSASRLNVTTSTRSYDFYGKYERESYSGSEGDFFFLNGGSLHPNNKVTTNLPYRWIIKVTGNSTNDGYSKISFEFIEDGATGINPSRIINSDEVEGIYTINGMKLDEPVKGVNIIRYKNGKTKKINIK